MPVACCGSLRPAHLPFTHNILLKPFSDCLCDQRFFMLRIFFAEFSRVKFKRWLVYAEAAQACFCFVKERHLIHLLIPDRDICNHVSISFEFCWFQSKYSSIQHLLNVASTEVVIKTQHQWHMTLAEKTIAPKCLRPIVNVSFFFIPGVMFILAGTIEF